MLEPLVVPVAGAGAGLDADELPLAAEPGKLEDVLPCTLDEVPLVGGQVQFEALGLELADPLLLDGSDEDPLALEGALALGELDELLTLGLELAEPLLLDGSDDDPLALDDALGELDELLMLGVELAELLLLDGSDDDPLALDGALALGLELAEPPALDGDVLLIAAEPSAVELPLAEEDALGGQEQFNAPLVEPLVVELPAAAPLVALPVAPLPLVDGKLCALGLLDEPLVLDDWAYAAPNAPITAAAVILTAR
jgi:hypothetical protein